MLSALRSSSRTLRRAAQGEQIAPAAILLAKAEQRLTALRAYSSDNYGYGYGFGYGPAPRPPPKEESAEGATEGEKQEEGNNAAPNEYQDFLDLPKGPTHKEMIAARRHYLKRQARRGLLPPSRPIRKPSF